MIATVPGPGVRRADGRVSESIPFLATCPKCKHQRAQDGYSRGELLRLLNRHHPVEAYCETCDHFWSISAQERSRLITAFSG